MEEEKEYHRRYLRAINHPLRKRILEILKEQRTTAKMLASLLGLNLSTLTWHLELLEYGHCIAQEQKRGDVVFVLTKEGEVINYLEGSSKGA
jgi:DNA-binding transcriptional ArsR family regulator